MHIRKIGTALITVALTVVASLVPQAPASAFNAAEVATYATCKNTVDKAEDFKIVKDYSRGLWEHLFDQGTVLYCGHDAPLGGAPLHGYTHIRIGHQSEWQAELDQLKAVIPNRAPATWQDLVDVALTTAISADRPSVTTPTGLCSDVVMRGVNLSTGASHQINVRVWTQEKSGGTYFPRNAVATAFPASTTCNEKAWPVASAKTSKTAAGSGPIVVRGTCDDAGCQFVMDSANVVAYSRSAGAYYVGGPFKTLWDSSRTAIGYPTKSIRCGLTKDGCYARYSSSGAAVYYTSTTKAHYIKGKIADKWRALGYENGLLAYPKTDEKCGLLRSGCFNDFEGGSIYYSTATGAWSVKGKIRSAWVGDGAEKGHFGYPVSDEYHPAGSPSNHRMSDFENGFLYWDGQEVTGEWGDPGCTTCRRHKVTF